MKKIFLMVGVALFFSILTVCFSGFSNQANAEDLQGNWQELEYGYQGVMERRDERVREQQFQQYQQQQYSLQQHLMNQKNMYNQSHPSKDSLKLGAQ